jgi:hypothetical protein
MSFSRRKFLRAGVVSALLAGLELNPAKLVFAQQKRLPGAGGFVVPYEAKTEPMFYFTHETFVPYLNSAFRLSRGKGLAFDATLIEVFDLQAKSQAKARAFSHAALGRFSLFVVPGAPSANGMTYTAVINRIA